MTQLSCPQLALTPVPSLFIFFTLSSILIAAAAKKKKKMKKQEKEREKAKKLAKFNKKKQAQVTN